MLYKEVGNTATANRVRLTERHEATLKLAADGRTGKNNWLLLCYRSLVICSKPMSKWIYRAKMTAMTGAFTCCRLPSLRQIPLLPVRRVGSFDKPDFPSSLLMSTPVFDHNPFRLAPDGLWLISQVYLADVPKGRSGQSAKLRTKPQKVKVRSNNCLREICLQLIYVMWQISRIQAPWLVIKLDVCHTAVYLEGKARWTGASQLLSA